MADFSEEQIKRYSRHILLPEIGGVGQKKLGKAKVLVVGTGGLGSPVAFYLAAAGIGTIGLIDMDKVDLSNLQRQIIHGTCDIGKLKVESARETIENLNPEVKVLTFPEKLSIQNVEKIVKKFDIVVDGCDNFSTRYLVNDACFFEKKPNVYGSVLRFEGRASIFLPNEKDSPCYRCLHPIAPPIGEVPSCAEAGVLGVVPGIIGVIQSTEAIKYILGIGNSLKGRLLLFDALSMKFSELKIHKNPDCPLCGKKPSIKKLIDYGEVCPI